MQQRDGLTLVTFFFKGPPATALITPKKHLTFNGQMLFVNNKATQMGMSLTQILKQILDSFHNDAKYF